MRKRKKKQNRGYAAWHRMKGSYGSVCRHNKGLMEEFLTYKSKRLSPKSLFAYREWIGCFLSWNYDNNGDKPFEEIKRSEFSAYFDWLSSLGLSPARISALKSAVSSMAETIEFLHEDDMPTFKNRVKHIEIPARQRKTEKTVLTEAKLKRMLNRLSKEDKEAACYLALLASSGCRRSEAAQMKVSFFNKRHEAFGGYVWETDELRSKGKGVQGKRIRKYVIKHEFLPYLEAWLEERRSLGITGDWLFRGKKAPDSDDMAEIAKRIKKICDPNFYSHSMRHYFCTKLKKKGLADDQIRDIFSWESVAMVKVYDDVTERKRIKKAFGKLSRIDDPKKKKRSAGCA